MPKRDPNKKYIWDRTITLFGITRINLYCIMAVFIGTLVASAMVGGSVAIIVAVSGLVTAIGLWLYFAFIRNEYQGGENLKWFYNFFLDDCYG